MDAALTEWLNLLLRWLHVVAAIYWVGQTYLFAWLDGRFAAAQSGKHPGVWMVHSGGFYRVDKLDCPGTSAVRLYWTWWESVLTWASGFALLVLVYWWGGLLLPAGATMSSGAAVAIGAGALLGGWLVYDMLWISPLARNGTAAVALSFALLVGAGWLLGELLAARAAFLHMGAMLGTIMAANVWVRILPAQRQMVTAIAAGGAADPVLAGRAKERSRHNGFLAVPVALIMVANHFPTLTYGHRHAWAMLAIFVLAGWIARWAIKAIER